MKKNALIASISGNIIEWYDFGLFIYLAPLFANLYFPQDNPIASLLMTLAVFAAGFIMRPIGAFLFGYCGDKVGRATALKLTILLISIPSFIIAVLPTHQQWGLWATVILVCMRLLQGLCIGGEFAGAMVYLVETAPPHRRAFFSSFNNVGSNIGLIGATGTCAILSGVMSEATFTEWGWRIGFFIGGLLGVVGLVLRQYLCETPVFTEIQQQSSNMFAHLRTLLTVYRKPLGFMLLILFVTASGCYALMNLLSTYLQTYMGYSVNQAMTIQSAFLALSLVLIPSMGWIADRVGQHKLLSIAAMGFSLFAIPCFSLLQQTHNALALLPLVIFFCIEQAVIPSLMSIMFPPEIRYLGASIAYNTTQTLIGGTAPLVIVSLIEVTQLSIIPALHLMLAGVVTLFALLAWQKQTMLVSSLES